MSESIQQSKKKRGKKNAICLAVLVCLLVCIAAGMAARDSRAIERSVTIEAGEPISDDLFFCSPVLTGRVLTDLSTIDTSVPSQHVVTVKTIFSSVQSVLTIRDTTPPTAQTVPVQTFVGKLPSAEDCVADIVDAGPVSVSYLQEPDVSAPGEQTGAVLLEDASGNTSTLQISVLVIADTQAPVISGVQDITVFTVDELDILRDITVTDDYDENPLFTVDDDGLDLSVPGVYRITYVAVDFAGNAAIKPATVTVIEDAQAPVISGVQDRTVYTWETFDPWSGISASDDYDETPSLDLDDGGLNTAEPGVYTLTYTSSDFSGNVATETAVITVLTDTQAPVISGVQDRSVFSIEEFDLAQGVSASDDFDENPVLTIDDGGLDLATAGVYTVTYTATDFCGNIAVETAKVTVIVDTQAPVISGVQDRTFFTVDEPALADGVSVSDDYDENPVLAIDDSALRMDEAGEYTVIYTATDFSGNVSTATAVITVISDTNSPTISGLQSHTIFAGDPLDYVSGVRAFDDYDESPLLIIDDSGLDLNTPGQYVVIFTAIDHSGNMVQAQSRVTVVADTEAPVISGVQNYEVYVDDSVDYISGVTATDNHDAEDSLRIDVDAGGLDFHKAGTYTVTYTCTDAAGNTAKAAAKIRVKADTTPPVITGAQDLAVQLGGTVSYRKGVTVTDDHDPNPTLTINNSRVNLNKIGTYKVSYTAEDASGNKSTVVVQLRVVKTLLTEDNLDVIYAYADDILKQIVTDDMSDMQKAFKIYGWTRNHIRYEGSSQKINWVMGAYDGFTKRYGDCYTYFSVAKALLTRAGIENVDVVKSDTRISEHFWSLINVGTGYYHFDSCPFAAGGDKFFMLTDEELAHWDNTHRIAHPFDSSLYPERATKSVQHLLSYGSLKVKE